MTQKRRHIQNPSQSQERSQQLNSCSDSSLKREGSSTSQKVRKSMSSTRHSVFNKSLLVLVLLGTSLQFLATSVKAQQVVPNTVGNTDNLDQRTISELGGLITGNGVIASQDNINNPNNDAIRSSSDPVVVNGVVLNTSPANATNTPLATTFNTNATGSFFNVRSTINPVQGGLTYELLDANGNVVQRVEKFFPVPPVPVCATIGKDVLYRNLRNSHLNAPSDQNSTIISSVQCCDFYIPSLGYQYTQCGQNLGIFILNDKKGSLLDESYLNQQLSMNNISWSGLVSLLNQYAINAGFQGNYTSFQSINVPWQDWYNVYKINPSIGTWTKSLLKDWINRYQQYIQAGGPEIIINQNVVTYNSALAPGNNLRNRLRRNLQVGPDNAPSVNNIINPPDPRRVVPNAELQQNDNLPQEQIDRANQGTDNYNQQSLYNNNNNNNNNQNNGGQPQQAGQYWLNDYDNDLILATTVIANLTDRGIWPLFNNWYQVFFYPNGLVPQYYDAQNFQNGNVQPNLQSQYFIGNVPPYMYPIVNWISTLLGNQVKAQCGQCDTAFSKFNL